MTIYYIVASCLEKCWLAEVVVIAHGYSWFFYFIFLQFAPHPNLPPNGKELPHNAVTAIGRRLPHSPSARSQRLRCVAPLKDCGVECRPKELLRGYTQYKLFLNGKTPGRRRCEELKERRGNLVRSAKHVTRK